MSENPQSTSPGQGTPPHQDQQSGAASPQSQPQPAQQPPPYQGEAPVGGYGTGQAYPVAPLNPSDERMWSVFAQLGPLLLSFIPPLVIWLAFKDRSRFVDQEAKEALNFQITMVIAQVAAAILTAVTLGFGAILYLAFIAALVFVILAAVANGRGEPYRYPVNIRFIK